MGLAASMGAVLLAGGAAHKRYSLPQFEDHDPPALGGLSGPGLGHRHSRARGDGDQGSAEPAFGQAHRVRPVERVKQDSDRDNFMSAEQARAYGIVDSMLEKRGELPIKSA